MAFPLDSLTQYIAEDLGVGTVGTDVFRNHMPDQPDTCVTVSETGGGAPRLEQGDNTDTPSFQVRARSLDASTARATLQMIFQALHGLTEQTLHGTHFKLIWALQSTPVPVGRDEKQRNDFVLNFRAMVAGVSR
jgi:hypothetical protein